MQTFEKYHLYLPNTTTPYICLTRKIAEQTLAQQTTQPAFAVIKKVVEVHTVEAVYGLGGASPFPAVPTPLINTASTDITHTHITPQSQVPTT